MEIIDSIVRLTWDPEGTPVVLVEWGDPMWSPVTFDGGQLVQEQSFVRGDGIKAYPRGNESHTLTFELAGDPGEIPAAIEAALEWMAAAPRTQADLKIEVEGGNNVYTLHDCAVPEWGGGNEEGIVRKRLRIRGGQLTSAPLPS